MKENLKMMEENVNKTKETYAKCDNGEDYPNFDVNEQLTEHFTLREMMFSQTCLRIGMINRLDEPKVIIPRLRALCENVLEPLRRRFGPVIINSGYRSECLNYVVGGVTNSQHCKGEAADLFTPDKEILYDYFDFIRYTLDFDQLIIERSAKTGQYWLHVSFTTRRKNRKMVIGGE